jgi:prevent-host-death family protein
MKTKSKLIGSFDAKTHLSSIIENVRKGNDYIITKRGKPVARLIPYKNNEDEIKIEEIISNLDSIRKSIKEKVNIKESIVEGRKY